MTDHDRRHCARQAGSGVVAAAAGLVVGEIGAAAYWPHAAPLTAVADAVIALAPYSMVRLAIDLFGTADKLVLNISVLMVEGFALPRQAAASRTVPAWPTASWRC